MNFFRSKSRRKRRDTEDTDNSETPSRQSERNGRSTDGPERLGRSNSAQDDKQPSDRTARPPRQQPSRQQSNTSRSPQSNTASKPTSNPNTRSSPGQRQRTSPPPPRRPNPSGRKEPNLPPRRGASPARRTNTPPRRSTSPARRTNTPPRRATSPPPRKGATPVRRSGSSPARRPPPRRGGSRNSRSPPPRARTRGPPSRAGSRSSSVNRRPVGKGRAPVRKKTTGGRPSLRKSKDDDSDEEEEEMFDEEWMKKDSRARRFTMGTRPELHEGAQDIIDDSIDRQNDLQDAMEEVIDALEDMEDHINDLEARKAEEEAEREAEEEENEDGSISEKSRRSKKSDSYPKPGSKPKVTFKPEFFEIKSGWLWKKGEKRTNWTRRYFKIHMDDPHSLYYYKNPSSAEADADRQRFDRMGKRINLLFAHTYVPRSRVYHKNKKIASEFEFYIQTKSSNNRTYERLYCLAAERADDLELWLRTLNYIEEQTAKCIQDHHDAVKRGRYTRIKKMDKQEFETKWDRAQNCVAYGQGLFEGTAGVKTAFTIQHNDHLGNPEVFGGLAPSLSVVLESQNLHYDLEVVDNDDGTYLCEYVPTRVGDYELSILLDDCDIYGSPFHPHVLKAPLSAVHCFAEGSGLYVGVVGERNRFKVHCRNQFDELVVQENVEWAIQCESPIEIAGPPHDNKDGTYTIEYTLNCSTEQLEDLRTRSSLVNVGTISVQINDHTSEPSFPREVIGSPFHPGLAISNTKEAVEAARTASQMQLHSNSPSGLTSSKSVLDSSFSSGSVGAPLSPEQKIIWDHILSHSSPEKAKIPTVTEIKIPSQQPSTPPEAARVAPLRKPQPVAVERSGTQEFVGVNGDFSPYLPIRSDAEDPSMLLQPQGGVGDNRAGQAQERPFYFETKGTVPSPIDVDEKSAEWTPHPAEAELVKESLIERSRQIQEEREEILRKQRELDVSTNASYFGVGQRRDADRVVKQAKDVLLSEKKRAPLSPSQEIPSYENVMDSTLIPALDKHSKVLERVYEYYSKDRAVDVSEFIRLAQDYDITPTFLTRKELRSIYRRSCMDSQVGMKYNDFTNGLALIAVTALSKPMFAHLYSTKLAKVDVLLNMWGVADATKLEEIETRRSQWA